MRINIIGGGLAGCSLAYIFKQSGMEPVVYEASDTLASGASGNAVGLYNPRFTAEFDAVGQFYSGAFFAALELFAQFKDEIDWSPCGALHLITDEKKARRFPKTVQNWGWNEDDMRIVDSAQATTIAGIELTEPCLYLPRSGTVSPRKLCGKYAQNITVHLNSPITDLSELGEGITVLACGMGCTRFDSAAGLPLRAVRGQVTYIEETPVSRALRCTLGYGGYIAPSQSGVHCLGSTFQRWLSHSEIIDEDDLANLKRLEFFVPYLSSNYKIRDRRASVRTTSKDHFPVFGQLSEGLYVSTAHGSHGILSSLHAALLLRDMICAPTRRMQGAMMEAGSPHRF